MIKTFTEDAEHLANVFPRLSSDEARLDLIARMANIAMRELSTHAPEAVKHLEQIGAEAFCFSVEFECLSPTAQAAARLLQRHSVAKADGINQMLWLQVLAYYRELDRDNTLTGERRRKQVKEYSKKGRDTAKKYSQNDIEKWIRIAKELKGGKRYKAGVIAMRLNLPSAAKETIRKAI